MFDYNNLVIFIAGLPGLLLALVLHEYAHARVAVAMGDFTPKLTGRLTLNPVAHIDIIGLIMLLVAHFGWAKPVMVNPRNFKDMRKGNILVALAGPMANFIVAFITLFIYNIFLSLGFMPSNGMYLVFKLIVIYNVYFGIFNLIPLPPLDGSKILLEFLPSEMAYKFIQVERYSFIILIALLVMRIDQYVLIPAANIIFALFDIILSFVF